MTKQKKEPSAKQLAARKAASERLKKLHSEGGTPAPEPKPAPGTITEQPPVDYGAMQKQLDEIMETNALLKAALLRGNQDSQDNGIGVKGNKLVGEVDKYLLDPENYPDPTPRLAKEPKLQPIAFNYNYELDYTFGIVPYETKTGLNMREPKFTVTLNRIVRDDQGNEVTVINPKTHKPEVKRYIAKRLVFHEDPQAALVIARENNLDVDKSDEKAFLDEMRYLRVRDWLFDIFWPKPMQQRDNIQEEVIGGTLVQVFTKASVEPSSVEFDQLKSKL